MNTKRQDVWNIPYDQNPYFTDRERELTFRHDGFHVKAGSVHGRRLLNSSF